MKNPLLLASLALAVSVPGLTRADASADRAYHQYRQEATEPTYHLAKIKKLIRKYNLQHGDKLVMPDAQYNSLTNQEKFTYAMIHGEDEDQNCDAMPSITNEQSKIFAHPLGAFNDAQAWNDRQRDFLHKHRGTAIALLRSTIKSRQRVGVNLKAAILELDAYELIPDMLSIYKRDRKDGDILTICMLLMKDGGFKPFVASVTYKKLYGDENTSYKAYINGNRANQDLEISRAMAYFRSRRS